MPVPTRPPQAPQVTRPAGPVSLEGIVERVTFESAASSYPRHQARGRRAQPSASRSSGTFPADCRSARASGCAGCIEHRPQARRAAPRRSRSSSSRPTPWRDSRGTSRPASSRAWDRSSRSASWQPSASTRCACSTEDTDRLARGRRPRRQAADSPGTGMARAALAPRRDGLSPGARREPGPRDAHRASLRASRDERRLARALPPRARRAAAWASRPPTASRPRSASLPDSPQRMQAGVLQVLHDVTEAGHVWTAHARRDLARARADAGPRRGRRGRCAQRIDQARSRRASS